MACVRKRRGKWVIDFYDQFGKRHWETLGTNKKEAEERLAKRLLQVGNETFRTESKTQTFGEIAERWFETVIRPNKRPTTVDYYQILKDRHLLPHFESIKVGRIDPLHIERFMKEKLSEGSLSKVTINKIVTALGSILSYAVRHRYIDYNPVASIEKFRKSGEEQSGERRYLKPEEIRTLLEKAEPRYKALFLAAVLTGLRQGELLGLQWGDIDWTRKQIIVRRSLSKGKFYNPKTTTSRRSVDMPPELIAELKRWKLACPISDLDLVFPNELGKPENSSNMMKRGFIPTLRRAELPKITFHQLRHTYSSLLIKQGEHPKYIQSQMGHSSIKVTMDTYGHLMEDVNQEAAKRLGATIFGDNGSKMVAETKRATDRNL
ncbi:MAG: tyrosine-type recombinase/integrase [Pseudomonadota bacterium]